MGEIAGRNRAACQRVVTNSVGRRDRFFNVALVEQVFLADAVGPDASIAVGLQLHTHRVGIGLRVAHRLAAAVEFGEDTSEVLHVVADFMGQHVSLGEVARSAELLAQLVVEREIDVTFWSFGQ